MSVFGTHEFGTFLFASFLLWITPGPDTMYIIARSMSQGRWAGVLSALGIGTGTIFHTIFAALGLSAILAASAWAFTIVKIVGACYLIYLGIQALRQPLTKPNAEVIATSGWRIFRQGVVCNALNPKVAIFFLAFLPQFVDPHAGLGPIPFLALGASFVVGGTMWCILVALCAAAVSHSIRRNPKAVGWLERGAGCMYIGLGIHLLRHRPQPA
jgi:threonine/homoserine/homoserine lactone efflux protein